MKRGLILLGSLAALMGISAGLVSAGDQPEPFTCPLSPIVVALPKGQNEDSGFRNWWYTNADHTIWAVASVLHAGNRGNKVPWIRPKGTQLIVTGRRLDADAEPLRADVPCCYGGQFQPSGLLFPSAGCWEISAKAGDSSLTFTTLVRPAN